MKIVIDSPCKEGAGPARQLPDRRLSLVPRRVRRLQSHGEGSLHLTRLEREKAEQAKGGEAGVSSSFVWVGR